MVNAVVDIETDAIDASTIHCIVARCYSSNEQKVWVQEECKEFGEWSSRIDSFIMHNGISFDAPILNNLAGSSIKVSQVRDTLIESQLYNPIREGGHSLEAWGNRLAFPKGEFSQYECYSPEMLEYCKRDVELTLRLARTLEKEGKNFSYRSYVLEQKIRAIVDQQQRNGFAFNLRKGMLLLSRLEDEQHQLEKDAEEMFKPTITYSPVKKIPKSTPFNIASRKQIAERLMEKGWKPKHHTDKDNIIINEAVLSTIKMEEAQMFSRYFLLQKRTGLLKSWIQACKEDGRVRGKVLTLKTVTGRMAHHSPNMAQIPASYSPYGQECRELWTVSNSDTHVLMGTDASSLELRCLAHYMDDSGFTSEVLTGDVHSANQRMAGLKTRDQAKTFIYAFLYGAGAAKIGKVVGAGAREGNILIKRFLKNMPALSKLRNNVQEAAERGWIAGLDGRQFQIRSVHASLNTLIQGAGAIVCKQWLLHMTDRIQRSGIDARLVASIHDEYQFEVSRKDTKRLGQIAKESIRKTVHTLGMKCNLDCEFKTGKTWAETH